MDSRSGGRLTGTIVCRRRQGDVRPRLDFCCRPGKQLDLLPQTRGPGPTTTSRSACRVHTGGPGIRPGSAAFRRAALVGGAGLASERVRQTPLPIAEARRELLHDATEALMGGWDPITPLKPHLGPGFSALVARAAGGRQPPLRPASVDGPTITPQHKRADRLAAANEAYHVVGWPLTAMREQLGIELAAAR